jgi:hypothetical protein
MISSVRVSVVVVVLLAAMALAVLGGGVRRPRVDRLCRDGVRARLHSIMRDAGSRGWELVLTASFLAAWPVALSLFESLSAIRTSRACRSTARRTCAVPRGQLLVNPLPQTVTNGGEAPDPNSRVVERNHKEPQTGATVFA